MGRKRRKKKQKKKSTHNDSIDIDDFWPSAPEENITIKEKPPPPPPPPPPQQPQPELTEEEKKKQQNLQMQIHRTMLERDIKEKNMQKAHRLWTTVIRHPDFRTVPNPPQWILGHEQFVKYWKHLKDQANQFMKTKPENVPIPQQVSFIINEKSPLRKYMEYMYVYFVD